MDPTSTQSDSTLAVLPLDPLDIGLLTYRLPSGMDRPEPGTRVLIPLGRRKTTGIVWTAPVQDSYKGEIREISESPDRSPVLPTFLHPLLEFGAWYYRIPLGSLAKFALPPSFAAPRPLSRNYWKIFDTGVPEADTAPPPLPPLVLDQEGAFGAWKAGRLAPDFAPTLLQGVTGSGKTRLYQEMVRTVLAEGNNVLVLTPEIGLVAPLIVAMNAVSSATESIHSRLTVAERGRGWGRILSGSVRIVIGPRSAVFAPIPSLGLVIVDEEHDSSYQAYEGLSFNARNLAIKRAQLAGIPVVLGSATPLSDSVQMAASGRYRSLSLPRRIGGFPLPPIQLLPPSRGEDPVSGQIAREIEKTLERSEQSVILLNRRGYAPTLACQNCHQELTCPSCSARLVLHKVPERQVVCHLCTGAYPVPTRCPSCHGRDLAPGGIATQKLEESLSSRFPSARILRLDQDQKTDPSVILGLFQKGEGDILLGTQVVAKGHDLPLVTCGIVLDADAMLGFPDYRASERAFGLWVQLAGRVGRHRRGGQVTLVTREPENPLFRWVRDYDAPSFYTHLMEERKALGYPPFCRIASVILSSSAEERIREILRERTPFGRFPSGNGIYGPLPALPPKLRNRYRAQILIKAPTIREAHARLSLVREHYRKEKNIQVEWQVDPLDLT